MKLYFLATFTTLLAAIEALPSANNTLEARKSINDCGPSTFIGATSGASPTVKDCKALIQRFHNGGTYRFGCGGEQKTLNTYGTCAFGAQSEDRTADVCYVGNSDASLAISNSIKKFAKNGKVGAAGYFTCQSSNSGGADHRIKWGLYHTK